jgi:hypothetical protein
VHAITISASWKRLRPARNFNRFEDSDETPEQYVARLSPQFVIPIEVAEQWLYSHYCNSDTVANYAWIDFGGMSFDCLELPSQIISELYVIKRYRNFVLERAKGTDYYEFTCSDRDIAFWKAESTWRVPPVVLDVASVGVPPQHADINGSYQLIEGHSRLGNFFSLKRAGKLRDRMHRVYMLHEAKS